MTWYILLPLAVAFLLFLFLLGSRVFVAFLTLNIVGMLVLVGTRGFGLFTNSIYETATSPTLITVALFVLMGEILFRSGSVDLLFDSVDRLVGAVRGRLYIVVILLATVFGALSGSAVAVAAMLGSALLPMMRDRGYDTGLSTGTILAGASLAPIIPPSLLAIIVGSLADVSIAGLLVAGIMPGLLFATLTLIYILVTAKNLPAAVVERKGSMWSALGGMMPFLLVVFSVMGLIMMGIATPSESAATGVVGAIIVSAVFGELKWAMLRDAISSAVKISAVLLIIVCSAKLFAQLLSLSGATRGLVAFSTDLAIGPDLMFLVLMLIPFIMCMFIDQIAFMLLAIPIYQPILKALEFDPIWFWTIFLINLTVGSLTPPFGYTLFAMKGATDLKTVEIFRAAWPIVGVFIFGIFILWAFPWIVTALPEALK